MSYSKLDLTLKFIFLETLTYAFFHKCSNLYKNYLGVLRMFNLPQLISDATRITRNSSSLTDHILSNTCGTMCQSGTISIGLSDQF